MVSDDRRAQWSLDALALTLCRVRLLSPIQKCKANIKSDVVWRLITDAETIPDNNDDIPSFILDEDDECFDTIQTEEDEDELAEPEYPKVD